MLLYKSWQNASGLILTRNPYRLRSVLQQISRTVMELFRQSFPRRLKIKFNEAAIKMYE